MRSLMRHFDASSFAVIAITLILFVAAIAVKGVTHDLLVEAAVFLVSTKLIVMSYKSSVTAAAISAKLDAMQLVLNGLTTRAGPNGA